MQYIDIPTLRPPLRLADLFAVELALCVLRRQRGEAASRPEAQDATHADDATSGGPRALTTPPHGTTIEIQCLPEHAGHHAPALDQMLRRRSWERVLLGCIHCISRTHAT